MHIAVFEAFYTGSHRQWADGLKQHLSCEVDLYTLEGRHWKWRMHGAAIHFAEQFTASLRSGKPRPDALLVSSMVDLCVFKALHPPEAKNIPLIYYFHENQLVYPWSPTDPDVQLKRDRHYAFIHYASALAADQVWFNSSRHRDQFLAALPQFLNDFPDYPMLHTVDQIAAKSTVVHLGLDLLALRADGDGANITAARPIILWNHRWEYDKNPNAFFDVLFQLDAAGVPFDLVLTGETFVENPPIFEQARSYFGDRILQFGYCESRHEYAQWLHRSHILPVTSVQDFFGISVVEAMACGVQPLLPYGLAYEEHLDDPRYFYADKQLYPALHALITAWDETQRFEQADTLLRYDWSNMRLTYQSAFKQVIDACH
jgi:glycosyltransferase involved in cell wall biosynthesis